MPVDAGVIARGFDATKGGGADSPRPDDLLETAPSLGDALRMRREARGMTLDQLSLATRIRPQYLEALEAMRIHELPSRPFVIGYVRACATALGLDVDQAVARLKKDAPDAEARLTAPIGVERKADPNFRLLVVLGVIVVIAMVAWNVVQRVMSHAARRPAPTVAVHVPASSKTPLGPLSLSAAQPPPAEATTPEPYVTPGLDVSGAPPAAAPPPAATQAVGAPFAAKGSVFGQPAAAAHIIFLADKPVTLVLHGPDGAVYFARQLEAGQAYAPPNGANLSVEVSNPAVVSVYIDRAYKGALAQPMTSLSTLNVAPAPAAAP